MKVYWRVLLCIQLSLITECLLYSWMLHIRGCCSCVRAWLRADFPLSRWRCIGQPCYLAKRRTLVGKSSVSFRFYIFFWVKEKFLCGFGVQLQGAQDVSWPRSMSLRRAWPQLCRKAGPSSWGMIQVSVLSFLLSQRKVSLWLRRAIARRARL